MPFETPFDPPVYDVTISATAHEHAGEPPSTIIRTDQSWAVNIRWQSTGLATGMITGNWHIHCYLERIGPGADLDLVDPADHIEPLTPGVSPVNYFVHFDVPAGRVSAGLYQLVVSMTYLEPTGSPGPMAGFVEGPMLQFYTP